MVHQTYIEPHAVMAKFDASGRVTVWVPTQSQFVLRDGIAEIFKLPLIKVRVIPTEIGGGFGGKNSVTIEAAAVALAMKSRMPVQIVMSRSEDFQCANPRHSCHMRYKTGVKLDGTIVARQVEVVMGTGGYYGSGGVVNTRVDMVAPGPYRIPNVQVDNYGVYTNTASCGPYRSPAGPQLTFASESQIDIIAAELGIDPLEMRLKNALEDGDKAFAVGVVKNTHAGATLRKVTEASGWSTKPKERNQGWGLAFSFWPIGGQASSAGVKLNEDGTVTVITGVIDLSGTITSVGQIAAEVLGVNLDNVHIRTADTDFAPHATIAAGSQALRSMGTATKMAAEEVKKQIFEIAADKLEVDASDLELEGKKVFVKGSPEKGLTLGQIGRFSLTHRRGPIISTQSIALFAPQPVFAAHVAQVEVDPETGEVKILRYVTAQDVGKAINPLGVRGQIQGSVMQGLGQAMSEGCFFRDGKMTNANFLDYKIFSSLDCPKVEVHLLEPPGDDTPFGAKGVAEPPIMPVPAVIANAIYDAIGVRIRDLPMSRERVVRAIQEERKH